MQVHNSTTAKKAKSIIKKSTYTQRRLTSRKTNIVNTKKGDNMLRIRDLEYITDTTVRFLVLVEGKESLAFQMTVDISKADSAVITSDVPEEYKMYESQACIALDDCETKPLPKELSSMFY